MVNYPLVYAARTKDPDTLKYSSSGGVFTPLSDVFLKKKNAVVCALYNFDKNSVEYRLVYNEDGRNAARGSKYIQSNLLNVFRESEIFLIEHPDKKILFIGMGCQSAGFKNFMENRKLADRVTTVDIICHGAPSPKVWRDYLGFISQNHEISSISFKDKRVSWDNPTAVIKVDNREILISDYLKLFYSKCILRPSCHKCPYATTRRKVDMTIGDYWGIEKVHPDFYNPMGNSLVLIHTDKGYNLFKEIKNSIDFKESDEISCLQPNLIKPTAISSKRDDFWRDYKNIGIEFTIKKYSSQSVLYKILKKIKFILHFQDE